jgi:flagellar biosynthesis protein
MADPLKKRAVALRYDPEQGDNAPRVVAKGRGHVAEQILELARKNDVPVREDTQLVQVLSRLNLDQEVPKEVYQAVATILAFLYKVNRPLGG